jgi:hypothetical protein
MYSCATRVIMSVASALLSMGARRVEARCNYYTILLTRCWLLFSQHYWGVTILTLSVSRAI